MRGKEMFSAAKQPAEKRPNVVMLDITIKG